LNASDLIQVRSAHHNIAKPGTTEGRHGLLGIQQNCPVVEPYPVVVAPRYVVRPAIVAAPPIVRERTIGVSRPRYMPALLIGPPVPPYVVADW
jgi:hypothetical protein